MFKKVVITLALSSFIISCQESPRNNSVSSTPLKLAGAKSASTLGITPEGKAVVFSTGSGQMVKPCTKGKGQSACSSSLVDPSEQVLELIESTKKTYDAVVSRNGKEIKGKLTFLAAMTFPDTKEQSTDNVTVGQKSSGSFMDSIISSAFANVIGQYCTTTYSGGHQYQNCISFTAADCQNWANIYGSALVVSVLPQCLGYV